MSEGPAADAGAASDNPCGHVTDFCLFIAGDSELARRSVANFDLHVRPVAGECELEVVDIIAEPGRAIANRILATPTLIRRSPEPSMRVVGDLSDAKAVGDLFRPVDLKKAVDAGKSEE